MSLKYSTFSPIFYPSSINVCNLNIDAFTQHNRRHNVFTHKEVFPLSICLSNETFVQKQIFSIPATYNRNFTFKFHQTQRFLFARRRLLPWHLKDCFVSSFSRNEPIFHRQWLTFGKVISKKAFKRLPIKKRKASI